MISFLHNFAAAASLLALQACAQGANYPAAGTMTETSTVILGLEAYESHCHQSPSICAPISPDDQQRFQVTKTSAGTRSTPYTVTKPPQAPGGPTIYVVYTPPDNRPSRVTETRPGTRTTPYTVQETPGRPGDPTTFIVFVPPKATNSPSPPNTPAPSSPGAPSSSAPSSPASSSQSSSSSVSVPSGACSFSPAACPTSGGKLTLKQYANSASINGGYGVSDGKSGAEPDYYLSLDPQKEGTVGDLSVPKRGYPSSSSYIPEPSKSASPNFEYFPGDTQTTGDITYDVNNFTLVFTGYFVPPKSGIYEFCANNTDNRDVFYFGSDAAFPCGSASKASKGAPRKFDSWYPHGSKCAKENLTAGFYYPIRSVFGNWGLPTGMDFYVTPPGGTASTDLTGMVTSESCK